MSKFWGCTVSQLYIKSKSSFYREKLYIIFNLMWWWVDGRVEIVFVSSQLYGKLTMKVLGQISLGFKIGFGLEFGYGKGCLWGVCGLDFYWWWHDLWVSLLCAGFGLLFGLRSGKELVSWIPFWFGKRMLSEKF